VPRLPLEHEQSRAGAEPGMEVRIDTLVLDGAESLDPAALEGAVQRALAALLASGGPASAATPATPDGLGDRLAAAVYSALPRSVTAPARKGSEG
jgi:hypothetical protein